MTDGPGYLSRPIRAPELDKDGIKRWPTTWKEEDLDKFMPERWLVEKEHGKVEFDANAGPVSGSLSCYLSADMTDTCDSAIPSAWACGVVSARNWRRWRCGCSSPSSLLPLSFCRSRTAGTAIRLGTS